jgi:hypothetical protein
MTASGRPFGGAQDRPFDTAQGKRWRLRGRFAHSVILSTAKNLVFQNGLLAGSSRPFSASDRSG